MVQREVTCIKWEATLSKNQGNTRMLNKNNVQKALYVFKMKLSDCLSGFCPAVEPHPRAASSTSVQMVLSVP